MESNKFNLILGSASPRRKELLSMLKVPFSIMSSDILEVSNAVIAERHVEDLSLQKLLAVKDDIDFKQKDFYPFIVSFDTIVVLNNEILGKPRNIKHAKEVLLKLSGQTHQVYTACSLFMAKDVVHGDDVTRTFSCKTDVTFAKIDEDLLENYLATGESLDKAGAYGIQGKAISFIEKIDGSYSNVVGLPLHELVLCLKDMITSVDDIDGEWRTYFKSNT